MFGPTTWVALGLLILVFLAWYYGRGAIVSALYARIRSIEARVKEVKEVLNSAQSLYEEVQQRHVVLERELEEIEKSAKERVTQLCAEQETFFRNRMAQKEEQLHMRLEIERSMMEENLRKQLLNFALEGVEQELGKSKDKSFDEKAQMAKAISRFDEMFSQ